MPLISMLQSIFGRSLSLPSSQSIFSALAFTPVFAVDFSALLSFQIFAVDALVRTTSSCLLAIFQFAMHYGDATTGSDRSTGNCGSACQRILQIADSA